MSGIFISYRRKDTAAYAGWLFQTLRAHFGEDQIFRDIDNIDPGDRFPEVIEEAIASCDVVIALIGEKWLTVTDDNGRPRLQNPDDHVRRELVAALLRNDVLLIPVLLDGMVIPEGKALPGPLRGLTERNALSLDSADWDADVGRLIKAIERKVPRRRHALLQPAGPAGGAPTAPLRSSVPAERTHFAEQAERPTPPSPLRKPKVWAALGVFAGAALTAGVVLAGAGSTSPSTGAPPTTFVPTTSTATRTPPPTRQPSGPTSTQPAPTTTTMTTLRPSTTSTTATVVRPDACRSGFVWREARPTDRVCVTPDTRQATLMDNGRAASRWVSGAYGPHTCVEGYVWREAFVGDDVCVTPRTREQALYDNSQASNRLQSSG